MIRQEWFNLYDAMIRDMDDCSRRGDDPKTLIECCFSIAQDYWIRIESGMEDLRYESRDEEILFYKEIKPMFKSHIEYYNLLYHAEIFKPVKNPGEMKEFWIKEQQRLDKFIQENRMFYEYHKSGSVDHDEEFFLLPASMDGKGKTVYHDDLIAMLMALERYTKYIQEGL